MARYILYRLIAAIPVILGVVIAVFFMVRLVPGDPVRIMFANQRPPSPEQIAVLRHDMGLDLPIHRQFVKFVTDVAQGDLGTSFRSKRPVVDEIRLRAPNTLKLAAGGLLFTLCVGIPTGVIAATRKGSLIDLLMMLIATVSVSIPAFWFGLMAILFFSLRLGWLPTTGADSWKHLILPSATLGLGSAAVLARITRSAMLEVLGQDYVRTARAKGLRERVVINRHALRNALIPIATIVGFQFGYLLAGSIIIEAVFAYPGLGMLAVQALTNRDFPVIQGIVLVTALVYVTVNLLVDVLYAFLDPRIRYS